MKVDVIIVGNGIAGACCAQILLEQKKDIVIFNHTTPQSASQVAAGLVNPVILKRFSPIWKGMEQMEITKNHFPKDRNILSHLPVHRVFHDENEVKTWNVKSQLPHLNHWLNPTVKVNDNPYIKAPFGLGEVKHTSRVNFKNYIHWIKNSVASNKYMETSFQYHQLKKEGEDWNYNGIKSKHIIFAEGMGALQNPFFPKSALIGNKGQILEIKTPFPLQPKVYKSKVFLTSLSESNFYVGATYERDFNHSEITSEGRTKLLQGLTHFFSAPFEIVEQNAGIRPTTKDRRPIIGAIPSQSNLWVINGLGSRGALLGPYAATYLIHQMYHNHPPHPEMDISRCYG